MAARPRLRSVGGEAAEPVAEGTAPWYRRRRVHVAGGLLVAILTAFFAGQRAAQGVRDGLDHRLRDAGAGSIAGLVVVESEQLSALRAGIFTVGVGPALASRDVATLNRLIAPVQANHNVSMLDVVLPDGRVVLAVRAKGAPLPVRSRTGMHALARSLAQARAGGSGRFSQLVYLRTGPTLLTIGPVRNGGRPVGAILVMTPLADVLGRLADQLDTHLNAYSSTGVPIATTSPYRPAALDPATARTLIAGGPVVTRYVHGNEREAVGRLIVAHQPNALLGIALEDSSWDTGRAVILYAAVGLLCTIVIAASFPLRIVFRRRDT